MIAMEVMLGSMRGSAEVFQPLAPVPPLFPEPLYPEPLYPEPLYPEPLYPEPLCPERQSASGAASLDAASEPPISDSGNRRVL